jgi:hypothetical protein
MTTLNKPAEKEHDLAMELDILSAEERESLLLAPALLSVLAASNNKDRSIVPDGAAAQLAQFKTFSILPSLAEYYGKAEKTFETDFAAVTKKYASLNSVSREALKEEMDTIIILIGKLNNSFASLLHESLINYNAHALQSAPHVVEDFLFPLPIHGLNIR